MSLFHKMIDQAIINKPELSHLKIVIEKELLHHDILRIMRDHNLMQKLTFIGGTCLRACYGSSRLSEDLDFTGGHDFSREQLSHLAQILIDELQKKYGLQVFVSQPTKDTGNVDTWKIKIETRQGNKNLPTQRINIDICAIPSYEKRSMILLNFYDIDMGTSGMIIQAQSREEIYTDKILAFTFRPNRIKYRDLWDILWLASKNIQPNLKLLTLKLHDRKLTQNLFIDAFHQRLHLINTDQTLPEEFTQEMTRFLSPEQIKNIINSTATWDAIINLMKDLEQQIIHILKS